MELNFIILLAAGFLGGMLNAIAGGGSFITLPALLFIGVTPVAANATGTAALLPGYIASAWRFRHDISYPRGLGWVDIVVLATLGGSIGALLLIITSDRLFATVIPWLILFATLVFAFGPRLIAAPESARATTPLPVHSRKQTARIPGRRSWLYAGLLFAVCLYGGYFNGGLGILLLAAFSAMGEKNLHAMNGLKNVVSALLALIAVFLYGMGGAIAFERLLPLALAALLGGYAGAALAYRIPQKLLRTCIVVIGCVLTAAFFLQP
ncbi:MAG: sulfite exporter TauE/SafE family protein [Desulfobulbaceae bacterium]|nr:sulfite exporter TauE/SafE family protein [Desulfobulbaceae bacterium]